LKTARRCSSRTCARDRAGRDRARSLADPTFHPTFLYELLWNLALAAALVWLDRHRRVRPPGLFALYVAGYCAFRIVDELLRVDPAAHVFGVRWNLVLSIAGTVIGLAWFTATQRGGRHRALHGGSGN
jgi:prolipoprotein diacylglyceryltransferase